MAYIGFGSNLGELHQNCQKAIDLLGKVPGTRVLRISPLYRTEPLTVGAENQPWYLNGVCEIQTSLGIKGLHAALQEIEICMGRKKHRRWQSRIMDLDLLFYDELIYEDADLRVPHREMVNRRFVLAPLADLIPGYLHPEFKMPVDELLFSVQDELSVMRDAGLGEVAA